MTGLIHVLNGADKETDLPRFIAENFDETKLVKALSECEMARVVVIALSTKLGVAKNLISDWQNFRDFQIPTIFAVSDLANNDLDFDDFHPIIGKILEPVLTPYLVLHAEDGSAAGLIDLQTLQIIDYSNGKIEIRPADTEHQELVKDFQSELLEVADQEWSSFTNGTNCIAIPIDSKNKIGLMQIEKFLDLIPSVS